MAEGLILEVVSLGKTTRDPVKCWVEAVLGPWEQRGNDYPPMVARGHSISGDSWPSPGASWSNIPTPAKLDVLFFFLANKCTFLDREVSSKFRVGLISASGLDS